MEADLVRGMPSVVISFPERLYGQRSAQTLKTRVLGGLKQRSAGINRREEGDERALHRRASDPRWPRAMRRRPQGRRRSVGRGTCRPAIEPRNKHSGAPTLSLQAEGNTASGAMREPLAGSTRSETLSMHGIFSRENREVPRSPAAPDQAAGRKGKAMSRSRR